MIKRIAELILLVITLFIVFNSIGNPTIFNLFILGLILITILSWTATHRLVDKIPKTPLDIQIVSFITISYGIYVYLEHSIINSSPHIIENFSFILFSMLIGFVIWNILIFIIMNIVIQTIDIENTGQDDPFNDRHAARILNEDN